MMSAEDLLEGRRQVLQEMKSVGDLGRLWSTLTNPCAIGFCSVTGHHLDFGMGLEPRGNGFSRPILKQVDGTAAFEIHDDRAVAMAFAPSPIIDANDVRLCPLEQSEMPHAPVDRSSKAPFPPAPPPLRPSPPLGDRGPRAPEALLLGAKAPGLLQTPFSRRSGLKSSD